MRSTAILPRQAGAFSSSQRYQSYLRSAKSRLARSIGRLGLNSGTATAAIAPALGAPRQQALSFGRGARPGHGAQIAAADLVPVRVDDAQLREAPAGAAVLHDDRLAAPAKHPFI